MSSRTSRRLLSELTSHTSSPSTSGLLSLGPNSDSDLFNWSATLKGPSSTPYEQGVFKLKIKIPENYPASPPTIFFEGKVFHPNVHLQTGEICLDVLKTNWSPVWTISSACLAIQSLLASPEPSSPLNVDAANLIRCGDMIGFESMAKMYTLIYHAPN